MVASPLAATVVTAIFVPLRVVLILLKILLQSFQSQRQWCIKILLPQAQAFHAPLMLGRVSKRPWQFSSEEVMVYKSPSPEMSLTIPESLRKTEKNHSKRP